MSAEATTRIVSRRLGTYDIPLSRIVRLPDGLIGLPEVREVALLEAKTPGTPFRYLLCLNEPDLVFLVCTPDDFFPGYTAAVPLPEGADPADVVVLALVTVPERARELTANLLAPLVLDARTRTGRQVVLEAPGFTTRHRLLPDA